MGSDRNRGLTGRPGPKSRALRRCGLVAVLLLLGTIVISSFTSPGTVDAVMATSPALGVQEEAQLLVQPMWATLAPEVEARAARVVNLLSGSASMAVLIVIATPLNETLPQVFAVELEPMNAAAEERWLSPIAKAAVKGLVDRVRRDPTGFDGVVLHFNLDDTSLNCPSRPAAVRAAVAKLAGDLVGFVTWGACVVNMESGAIGRSEFVLPRWDSVSHLAEASQPPWPDLMPAASWRPPTLDHNAVYDHFVLAFRNVMGADVAYASNYLREDRKCRVLLHVMASWSVADFKGNRQAFHAARRAEDLELQWKLSTGALVVIVRVLFKDPAKDEPVLWFQPQLRHGDNVWIEDVVNPDDLNGVVQRVMTLVEVNRTDAVGPFGIRSRSLRSILLPGEIERYAQELLRLPKDYKVAQRMLPVDVQKAAALLPPRRWVLPFRDETATGVIPAPYPSYTADAAVKAWEPENGSTLAAAVELRRALDKLNERHVAVVLWRNPNPDEDTVVLRAPFVRSRAPPMLTDRMGSSFFRDLAETMNRMTPPDALFVLSLEDAGVYCDPSMADVVERFNARLNVDTSRLKLVWLTFNACADAQGRIGFAEAMVPAFDAWRTDHEDIRRQRDATPFCRRRSRVAWRGATTGVPAPGDDYSSTDRYRVVQAFTDAKQRGLGAGTWKTGGASGIDVAFTRLVGGVTAKDVPAAWLGAEVPALTLARNAVQLDVDGNANAWESLRWKLMSGSVVVKLRSPRYVQWYYHRLVNGTHLLLASNVKETVWLSMAALNARRAADAAGADAADSCTTYEAIADAAGRFGDAHLTRAAMLADLERTLREAHANVKQWSQRDWRIQQPQHQLLRRRTP